MNYSICTDEYEKLGDVFFFNTITEAISMSIPDSLKKYFQKQENRQKLLDEFGSDAFLLPDSLKFPVINPFTKDYDCRLIYAAYIRSKQHKYPEVEKKATKLYSDQKCESKIKITLKTGLQEGVFNCDELFEIFEFNHSYILENEDKYNELLKDNLKILGVDSVNKLNELEKNKFFNNIEKQWSQYGKNV